MSRPKTGRSRFVPALIVLLIVLAGAAAVWFFLFRTPAGLADSELTGFLPRDAVITANVTKGKTQTVEYAYRTETAYCDAQTSARRIFRYAGGGWTADGPEQILGETEDWSRLAGTWTDPAEPDLTIVIQALAGGAVAGTVTYGGDPTGMFDDYFTAGKKEEDGTYTFSGTGMLTGSYLRIERENGLLFSNTDRPMRKNAVKPGTPAAAPAGTLEISRDGVTQTVDASATAAPQSEKKLVATAALNIRPDPSTDQEPLDTVEIGTVLPYTSMHLGWYQVEYQGGLGYVSADYIQDLSAPDGPQVSLLASTAEVNVRSGPGTENEVLTTVQTGARMIATGLSDGWYQIRYNAGCGYISAEYVTVEQTFN